MLVISSSIKKLARNFLALSKPTIDTSVDPKRDPRNKDPNELFRQIMGLLRKMGVNSSEVQRSKTQIMTTNPPTDGDGNSLYRVMLRRPSKIDEPQKIYRNRDNFGDIERSPSKGELILNIWAPYKAPAK